MKRRGVTTLNQRIHLFLHIWMSYALVRVRLGRLPLPAVVASLGGDRRMAPTGVSPRAQGRMVWRHLRIAGWRPVCLPRALVLYHLLSAQGTPAALVIGLADQPNSKEAHAWVEAYGVDVGPPPGRSGHVELARYGH